MMDPNRTLFLYRIPAPVLYEFCRIMDSLPDLDWTRFASQVMCDQTDVRLAERRGRRTDAVMDQWGNRNGRVEDLIDLLERLQLLRPRDIIMDWLSSLRSASPPAPLPPPPPPPPSLPSPPPTWSEAPPTLSTCRLSSTVDKGGGRPDLPRPDPPPPGLQSDLQGPPQPPLSSLSSSGGVMCWSYEEVHAGTWGFSPSLRVGEGGFGVVYRATLRNTECAVKRLKQDCLLDWNQLKDTFRTEVDTLSRFRHPHILDLLGFCESPECVCLIYSYMDHKSLEDQLHNGDQTLSWSQRINVVSGASAGLQFLHSPPSGTRVLVHGDVKSSNILLDRHLEARLGDFGLARLVPPGSATQTGTVGRTATVRGTLAYLPPEYLRDQDLGTVTDVYSFGVVLLEVLTGRRALETDRKSGDRYLKDLVYEVEESPAGPSTEAWREHLDPQLVSGGPAESGVLDVLVLACSCLDRKRKKRPSMTQVFSKLKEVQVMLETSSPSLSSSSSPRPPSSSSSPRPPTSSSSPRPPPTSSSPRPPPSSSSPRPPSSSSPRPPTSSSSSSLDSVGAVTHQLSRLGPLEDVYQSSVSSQSSQSSWGLTTPHPLHSTSSLPPPPSSSLPPHSSSSSSLAGPCETDESRGFSQYQSRPSSSRDCSGSGVLRGSGVLIGSGSLPGSASLTGATPGPASQGQTPPGLPGCISPMRSLQPVSALGPSDEGSISVRGPEESDELDYLPASPYPGPQRS